MSIKETPQKILAGRRVALPTEFLEKNKMNEGEIVLVRLDDDGTVVIIPAEVRRKIAAA
jgi:hypothetical protein